MPLRKQGLRLKIDGRGNTSSVAASGEALLTHPLTMTLGTRTSTLRAGKFLFWYMSAGSYTLRALYGAVAVASVTP